MRRVGDVGTVEMRTADLYADEDQPYLLDVLEGLAAIGEPAGDVMDEIAVELDEAFANSRVARLVEFAQQTPHLGPLSRLRRLRDRSLARRHTVAATRRGGHDALYLVSRTRRLPVRSSTRYVLSSTKRPMSRSARSVVATSSPSCPKPACSARALSSASRFTVLRTVTSSPVSLILKTIRTCPAIDPECSRQRTAFSQAWATAMVRSSMASMSNPASDP